MERQAYPVGIQSFEQIRTHDFVYVDKTAEIYDLVRRPGYYFLARPRRFGKSLLLSTLAAYFEGKRNLFEGLAIDHIQPGPWEARPVVRLDLSGRNFETPGDFRDYVRGCLENLEKRFGLPTESTDISVKFAGIVTGLHEQSGRKVAILIDEYDSPMTGNMSREIVQNQIRDELYGFYSVIKTLSEHIHFCILTGVTRFGKLSIFSALNNLDDISMTNEFSTICGITEEELKKELRPGVEYLAKTRRCSFEKALSMLKRYYDGYHFSEALIDIYNPFSLFRALKYGKIENYWFETGTPTMLVDYLKNPLRDISDFNGMKVTRDALSSVSLIRPQTVALLYQTGYLTIKSYEFDNDRYVIGFPNREVESGFFSSLLPIYADMQRAETDSVIARLTDAVRGGDVTGVVTHLSDFIASIPSDLHRHTGSYESHYQLIIYLLFRLIGLDVKVEYQTSDGYIDILMQTPDYVYVMELKVRGSAADAIRQIDEKGYAEQFKGDSRHLFRIGMSFCTDTHRISDSIVE